MKRILFILTFSFLPFIGWSQIVSAGHNNTFIICGDSSLYALGENIFGQLGLENNSNVLGFTKVNLNEKIVAVSAGINHTLILTDNRDVWTSGYNKKGQLGIGNKLDYNSFQKVNELENIISITSGEDYSIAVKNDGSVWVFGNNSVKQLGVNNRTSQILPVKSVEQSIKKAVASSSHTVLLSYSGEVFVSGLNYNDMLLDSNEYLIGSFTTVKQLQNIVDISSGANHTLALDINGKVYAWGHNNKGVFGNNSTINSSLPIDIGLSNIAKIASGHSHNLAIDSAGKVYSWGYNHFAQLGNGTYNNSIFPVEVIGLNAVENVFAGQYNSFALDSSNNLYAWGLNEKSQLGDSTTNNLSIPKEIILPCSIEKIESYCSTQAIANVSKSIICIADSVEFIANSVNTTTNKWSIEGNEISLDQTWHSFGLPGTKEIQLIANPYGCSDTTTITVDVLPRPDATIISNIQYCENDTIIDLEAIDNSGIWSGNGIVNASLGLFDPSIVFTGSVSVSYLVSNTACSSTDTIDLIIKPLPTAGFSINQINDSTLQIINESTEANDLNWSFGDGNNSIDNQPIHTYNNSGTYNVVQVVQNECGIDSISKQITISLSASTNINNQSINSLSFYPNPVKNNLIIEREIKNSEEEYIEILNANGKVVLTQIILNTQTTVDISNLSSGNYFINHITNDFSNKYPFVICK